MLESVDCTSAAQAISALMSRGILAWPQLQVHAFTESDSMQLQPPTARWRGSNRFRILASVFASSLMHGFFGPLAFRCLPPEADAAWHFLTCVLRLLREDGDCDMQTQRKALEELWEVLCALRGAPSEFLLFLGLPFGEPSIRHARSLPPPHQPWRAIVILLGDRYGSCKFIPVSTRALGT